MHHIVWHIRQYAKYLACGGTAAVVDFGIYFLLLRLDVWYPIANVIGGVLGFFTLFLLHKYVVFQKRDSFLRHLKRYFAVDMVNLFIITILLYFLVDMGGLDERLAKFVAFAPVVLWNFFVYKFLVYI